MGFLLPTGEAVGVKWSSPGITDGELKVWASQKFMISLKIFRSEEKATTNTRDGNGETVGVLFCFVWGVLNFVF